MRPPARNLTIALLAALVALPASGQIFMSEAEALKVLFPQATWTEEVKALDDEARLALIRSTRLRFPEPSYRFHVARAGGHFLGYALTLEEIGKSEPITFTVGLDTAGKVTDVILLVYRENRGGEVRDPRFLRQFRGKSNRDPIQVDRDVLNYSGATLSCQALARGVRKAIVLVEHFYHPAAQPPALRGESRVERLPLPRAHQSFPRPRRREEVATTTAGWHYVQVRYLMGTLCAVEVYAPDRARAERAVNAAFEAMHEVDSRMSNYRPESELNLVNRHATTSPVRVSEELFQVLVFAQRLSDASDGAFDITVAPLLRAWGFLPARGTSRAAANVGGGPVPSRSVAGATVGYRKVRLDPATHAVRFTLPGVELDLGGIAKGYAVDAAVKALRAWGIKAARVSAGGSTLYALGVPPGAPEGWKLVLPTGQTITVRNAAVSSSGHSERFVEIAGRRYSHIFDPRRGEPVSTPINTVSVMAPTAMESDALTKPFFMLNEREQERLREYFPRCRIWISRERALAAVRP